MIEDLLLKWEVYKTDCYSQFTNLDLEVLKEYHAKHFGFAFRNMGCASCINELIKSVFKHYEQCNQPKPIETTQQPTIRHRRRRK
jgi:hypothetical protein